MSQFEITGYKLVGFRAVFSWVLKNQNQTNNLPIIPLGQSQTIVKPKPNQLDYSASFKP